MSDARSDAVTCMVAAGPWETFDLVAHPAELARAVPTLRDVVFLTDQREGIGTVFACQRQLGDVVEQQTVEIAEYEPDHLVRYIAEADDNLWDLTYRIAPRGGDCTIALSLSSRAARSGAGTAKGVSDQIRDAFAAELDKVSVYLSDDA